MIDADPVQELAHATAIAYDAGDGQGLQGVLLRGPSGAGKSDLALRLIDGGWRLVADDQTLLQVRDGCLLATAPEVLAGKLEVRGLGIVSLPHAASASISLLVDLVEAADIERLPEPADCTLLGVTLPLIALNPKDSSAPAKLRLAAAKARRPIMPEAAAGGGEGMNELSAQNNEGLQADRAGGRRLILVTGLSGAGRSTALNTLEDLGYETIDNLPLELLEASLGGAADRPLALGIDIRTRSFAVEPLLARLDRLVENPTFDVSLLYLHCDDEVLRRRYSETRRRHPLALDRPLIDGITAERRLIAPLRDRADLVIDTSSLTPGDFRQILSGHLGLDSAPGMSIFVLSFAYRLGLPRAADTVFDVRFLANPHYREDLRPLTGRDRSVADFIRSDSDFEPFYDHLKAVLWPLLPRYEKEGKSYLTIAFGCTGGRHRSVMLAESLAADLRDAGWQVTLVHRDIAKGQNARASDQNSA